ncbi:NDP-sugar epimerase, includes UDP-GlcNAc-inverting 4,6-dehydratase FlaA1 and capsular polysaccharide biosynthesis protein EpsC [Algoriella xinjiangensis]|uniref:NDP-sugar epimerase, includes UDP-GlcNAc-inverting 4,6-dehydratase FlaA1 and capsular polysaccharide biosynthesis protein EpsC n=1 Tax=Algoriella xinjiangensis TaxID=684065 RepID=A0A1I4XHZ0_9FLAO|nr:nucleoside-diphosphate sugar epimerase/dehydratase [Algoriella xinjiangensis]SFN25538.1 NDP-sugar epimerase, includes UDP-GlcNAc-inverting 4,6-dehydratase FlaA1 and capsular polysaccharide biosynthesis protein EpsC [Algoriella xinjiangensis]VDH17656.1 UDP-glucose 4-epimerase [Algoriella xinjiangensis]
MNPFNQHFNAPRWVVLIIDILIVFISYIASNFILNSFLNTFSLEKLLFKLPIVVILYFICFLYFKTYKGIVKKTGLKDAENVFISNISAFLILLLISFVFRKFIESGSQETNIFSLLFRMSYSVIFVHLFITTVIMVVARLYYKWIYDYFFSKNIGIEKVLIYGAGDSGYITRDILQNDTQYNIKVIGFIDDNPSKIGKIVDGVKIYSINDITNQFVEKHNISEIIISIQNVKTNQLLNLSKSLEELPVKIKIIPPISKWIDGTYKSKQIKELKIEDLLGRESIKLDNPIINQNLQGKKVLITGAAGSIGSEIARQIAVMDIEQLILIDQAESALYDIQQTLKNKISEEKQDKIHYIVSSVRDQKRMSSLFNKYRPQVVFHAAAYKHVPLMEKFPYEAINTNIYGTKIIADLANEFEAEKFVMVSTDKAVNPTNVMGATKRVAEIYVNCISRISKTNYIVTRFGNVLGSNGSVIPLFKRQLDYGGPLTVTHPDITRFFMTIPEACQLVLEAAIMGKGGEIFVFDMGESMKIIDLAKRMIRLSGYKYPEEIDIKIVGLRPGEKIYEELLATDENTVKTHHEKIMIAKVNTDKCDKNKILIEELCLMSSQIDKHEHVVNLVARIKEIVPEFKSKNSEFEKLDNLTYEK